MGLDSHADEGTGAPLVLVDHYALVVEDGVVHDKCSTGEEAMRKLIDHCKALVEDHGRTWPAQMIITLEDNALVADIKRALKMIRGIASVRTATISDDHTITPAMRRSINKARREHAKGETIKCSTPEEMQRYFDSL